MKNLRLVFLPGMLAALALMATASQAGAYGNSGPAKQTYQLTFSFNCNNPSACSDLGGFWGWAVLYNDGTGDAELTGCSHLQGGGPAAGAQHFHDDFLYDLSNTTELVTTSETATFTGRQGGPPQTITVPGEDTGIPLVPGHYNASKLFGFTPPPGVNIEIQVVKLR